MGNTVDHYDSDSDAELSDFERYGRRGVKRIKDPTTYLKTYLGINPERVYPEWVNDYPYMSPSKLKINNNWEIYTKKGCTYCHRAIQLLDELGIKYINTVVTEKNKSTIYKKLDPHTNEYRYFPMIFNDGNFIGGYDELATMMKGKVKLILPREESFIEEYLENPIEESDLWNWTYTYMLLYLRRKYENDCVVIPTPDDNPDNRINRLIYHESLNTILAPIGYWDYINACKSSTKRFVVMPFAFDCRDVEKREKKIDRDKGDYGHANWLIYDFKTKSMERFEPNAALARLCDKDIDLQIQKLFAENMGKSFIAKYYSPLDFCPKIKNVQTIQSREKEFMKGDPGGFCMAWSAWYADLRLSNPDKDREVVLDLAIKKIQDSPKSFTEYIRSYFYLLRMIGDDLRNLHSKENLEHLTLKQRLETFF